MTLIEFFDESVAENLCSSLLHLPDRVVFIGHNRKIMERHAQRYRSFFRDKGADIEFIVRSISKNSVEIITDTFEDLLKEYDDCVFDLTGGDALYLFGAGIISERHREKNIPMHYINIRTGIVYDCDLDGEKPLSEHPLEYSFEDNVHLYGGKVLFEDDSVLGTRRWDVSAEFLNDLWAMWDICRADCNAWNSLTAALAIAESNREPSGDPLVTRVSRAAMNRHWQQAQRSGYPFNYKIINDLLYENLLLRFEFDNSKDVYIEYRSEQVKDCLLKSGLLLELIIYAAALEAREADGTPTYNSVMTGIYIDWSGEEDGEDACTPYNEVDVAMMHGMVPVFISCKNGQVTSDELYKTKSVALQFGGKHAKFVLVAPRTDELMNPKALAAFVERCKEMGFSLIMDIEKKSRAAITKLVKDLWSIQFIPTLPPSAQ